MLWGQNKTKKTKRRVRFFLRFLRLWTFLHGGDAAFVRSLSSVCLLHNTRVPLSFCQPFLFFSVSVLMNLETKVECKRLEAASVSSFSTKISSRYDWLTDWLTAGPAHPPPAAPVTPTPTWCDFYFLCWEDKLKPSQILYRDMDIACFGGTKQCNTDDLRCWWISTLNSVK